MKKYTDLLESNKVDLRQEVRNLDSKDYAKLREGYFNLYEGLNDTLIVTAANKTSPAMAKEYSILKDVKKAIDKLTLGKYV